MSVHQSITGSQHSLNNSPSKQKFSFSKAQRFPSLVKSICEQAFYQIPPQRSRRTTSFGVGEKLNMIINKDCPPPNRYTLDSQFQSSYLGRRRGFSFGVGRDIISGGPLDESKHKIQIPGPGKYEIHSTLQPNFAPSLKSRLPDYSQKYLKSIPGPGYYNPPAFINEKGKYILSKLANSPSRSFSPLTSVTSRPKIDSKIPGPATYDTKIGISAKGQYFISKYKNSKVRTFQKTPRPDISKNGSKNNLGPGYYKIYSEFG